ncbi:hypothetical protein NIES4071_104020 (plasmid) [Calothrix sp. NIES-4071]|nr:hypothetical protein NIES4071_104020 [Calothrix sp. NIES-4071]BAZ64389.1 hypothetical protein NIES4105_101220 [Calothrix sp. NIES-4105]
MGHSGHTMGHSGHTMGHFLLTATMLTEQAFDANFCNYFWLTSLLTVVMAMLLTSLYMLFGYIKI